MIANSRWLVHISSRFIQKKDISVDAVDATQARKQALEQYVREHQIGGDKWTQIIMASVEPLLF